MSIDESLKDNLIADVENILSINISHENTELLKRCFEITIGHRIKELRTDMFPIESLENPK